MDVLSEDIDMDEFRRMMSKTSVWWDRDHDIESVGIENYIDVEKNMPRPQVIAYGLVTEFPYNYYPIFISNHFGKYTPEKMEQKIQKMRDWAKENPAPANMFLITDDDEDYSDIIAELRSRGYNIRVIYSRAKGILPSLYENQSYSF